MLAKEEINGLTASWKRYDLRLGASETDTNARLVISASTTGNVWLDMISLFPRDTDKNRSNGMRADLA